ncbi:MAG: hypothetical protein JF603_08195 [Acidobacteria bacterium]|nr:hypothetical protein [Acidobacteriota bacterium]
MADADPTDNKSELLDDELIEDAGDYPPEQARAVDELLGATKERDGESFGHRVTREQRDEQREPDRLGPLVAPGGEDVDDVDDEASEVASEMREVDGTRWDVAQEHEEVLSAEEAAMHLTDDPPMDDDDGYLSD